MNVVFTLAGLTLRDAYRRRVFIGALVVVALFIALLVVMPMRPGRLDGGGFEPSPEVEAAIISWAGLGMIRLFSAILGVALAAGSLATELDRGTLYVILSKPLRRWQVVLGKWLGLTLLMSANVAVWAAVVGWAAYRRSGSDFNPELAKAAALTLLYPGIFVTLTMLFSSCVSQMLATTLGLAAIGVGWAEGLLHRFGEVLDSSTLESFSVAAGYLVPIGRLYRWIFSTADLNLPEGILGPLDEQVVASADQAYIVAYIAGALLLTMAIFGRREISG